MSALFLKKRHTRYTVLLLALVACSTKNTSENKEELGNQVSANDSAVVVKKLNEKRITNSDTSYLEYVFRNYELVNIKHLDSSIQVDLKYADTSNFLKKNLYDGLRNAYLTCDAAIRLGNAQYFLKKENPNYSLVVFDAARPLHIQQMMWDSVKLDTATRKSYLAAPNQTGLHNYACAVDVSIMDVSTGKLVNMGTPFDFFGKLSQPAYELIFLKDSTLSKAAYDNRMLLRQVMRKARFNPITSEWWHFSICSQQEAWYKYKLIK